MAAGSGPFDGTYSGIVTNVKQASVCGSQDSWHGIFAVDSNKFKTNIGKYVMAGDVRPDGSFQTTTDMAIGPNAIIHFVGNIAGDTVHADATGPLCKWSMDMRK